MLVHRSVRVGVCLLALALVLGGASAASAAGHTLRIEPPSGFVAKDSTFDVRVVQNASIATSGAQATITFDPALLQITAVNPGRPYEDATVFLGADADAIATANATGSLDTVAAAFLPPAFVPTDDQEFVVITFRALGCGASQLGLPVGPAAGALLDGTAASYGSPLRVTATGATVSLCGVTAASTDAAIASPGTTRDGLPISPMVLVGLAATALVGAGLWSRRQRA